LLQKSACWELITSTCTNAIKSSPICGWCCWNVSQFALWLYTIRKSREVEMSRSSPCGYTIRKSREPFLAVLLFLNTYDVISDITKYCCTTTNICALTSCMRTICVQGWTLINLSGLFCNSCLFCLQKIVTFVGNVSSTYMPDFKQFSIFLMLHS
jgi:hypothetical protein